MVCSGIRRNLAIPLNSTSSTISYETRLFKLLTSCSSLWLIQLVSIRRVHPTLPGIYIVLVCMKLVFDKPLSCLCNQFIVQYKIFLYVHEHWQSCVFCRWLKCFLVFSLFLVMLINFVDKLSSHRLPTCKAPSSYKIWPVQWVCIFWLVVISATGLYTGGFKGVWPNPLFL